MSNKYLYEPKKPVLVEQIGSTTVEIHVSDLYGFYAIDPNRPSQSQNLMEKRPNARFVLARANTEQDCVAKAASALGFSVSGLAKQ